MLDTAQHGAVNIKHPRYHDQKKTEFRNEEVKMGAVFLEHTGLLHTSVKGIHFLGYCQSFLVFFPDEK